MPVDRSDQPLIGKVQCISKARLFPVAQTAVEVCVSHTHMKQSRLSRCHHRICTYICFPVLILLFSQKWGEVLSRVHTKRADLPQKPLHGSADVSQNATCRCVLAMTSTVLLAVGTHMHDECHGENTCQPHACRFGPRFQALEPVHHMPCMHVFRCSINQGDTMSGCMLVVECLIFGYLPNLLLLGTDRFEGSRQLTGAAEEA